MKIAVYTIAKNESENVISWANSNREADVRLVCDTGSTDDTIALLRDNDVEVINIAVQPWRFDVARQTSLNLLPADVDVCIWQDLDELLLPGWRNELENVWTPGTTIANHRYRHNGNSWQWHSKIHARHGCIWTGVVHETLKWHIPEQQVWAHNVWLDEHQTKSKDRSFYLKLIEQKIAEGDKNWRTFFFMAGELAAAGDANKSLMFREQSFELCDEGPVVRSYIARHIALSYSNINDTINATKWFKTSVFESPEREALYYYSKFCKATGDEDLADMLMMQCRKCNTRRDGFTYDSRAWEEL